MTIYDDAKPLNEVEANALILFANNLGWKPAGILPEHRMPFHSNIYYLNDNSRFWLKYEEGFINIYFISELKYSLGLGAETKISSISECIMDNKPLPAFKHLLKPNIKDDPFFKKSSVNNPVHYEGADYEAIKVIEAWGLNFNLGNTLKYISRAGKKDNIIQDLEKAAWYLNREINNLKNENSK